MRDRGLCDWARAAALGARTVVALLHAADIPVDEVP